MTLSSPVDVLLEHAQRGLNIHFADKLEHQREPSSIVPSIMESRRRSVTMLVRDLGRTVVSLARQSPGAMNLRDATKKQAGAGIDC